MLDGVIVAFGLRIMTAGVDGANIGGGLFLLVGFPLCVAGVLISVLFYRGSR